MVRPFAAVAEEDIEGEDLLSVVKRVRAHGCCQTAAAAVAAAAAAAVAAAAAAASFRRICICGDADISLGCCWFETSPAH